MFNGYIVFFKTIMSNGTIGVLGLVSGAFIARILGPELRGVLAEITIYVPILVVAFSVSISDSLNKVILTIGGGNKNVQKVKSSAFWIVLITSFLVFILSLIIQCLIFFDFDYIYFWSAILYTLFGFFGVISSSLLGLEIGTRSYSSYNIIRIFSTVIYCTSILLIYLVIDRGQFDILIITFCLIIPVAVIAIYRSYKFLFGVSGRINKLSKIIMLNSASMFPSSLVYTLGKNVDKIVIAYIFDGDNVGIYIVASGFFQALVSIGSGGIGTYAMNVIKLARSRIIFLQVLIFYVSIMMLGVVFFYKFPNLLYGHSFNKISDISLYVGLLSVSVAYRDFSLKVLRYYSFFKYATIIEAITSLLIASMLIFNFNSIEEFVKIVSSIAAFSIILSLAGSMYAFNKANK